MTRGRLALCSLVTGAALIAAASAMTRLVEGWWLRTAALSVLILTAAVLLVVGALPRGRRRASRPGEPLRDPITGGAGVLAFTLIGYGTAIWWVLARFGGADLAFDPTPNRATLTRIAALIAEVGPLINEETAPIESSPPIALLLMAGVLLAALAANLFLVAGKPALVALPLIALWLPTLAFAQAIPLPAFVGTAVGMLALLALTASVVRPGHRAVETATHSAPRRRGQPSVRARQIGTAVTAGALVVALAGAGRVAGANETVALRWFQPTSIGLGDGFLTGEYVDLTQDLPTQSQHEVFRYATGDGHAAGPFAIRTLTRFDGRTWTPTAAAESDPSAVVSAEDLKSSVPAPGGSVAINIGLVDRETPVLPVPTDAWSTREVGPWYFNRADKSLVNFGHVDTVGFIINREAWTAESLRAAEDAHVEDLAGWFPHLDPAEVLRNAGHAAEMHARRDSGVPPTQLTLADGTTVAFDCADAPFAECGWGLRSLNPNTGEYVLTEVSVDLDLLAVPANDYSEAIRQLASEVVGDAPTAYDQALAIQDWLRNPVNFTYELQAPQAVSGDVTWDFLTARTGYCVHFATAMAMLARHLGIPARVVTGFLSGPQVDGHFVVTADRAHMWPELQLPGAGWVRFEPTPARSVACHRPTPTRCLKFLARLWTTISRCLGPVFNRRRCPRQPWLRRRGRVRTWPSRRSER